MRNKPKGAGDDERATTAALDARDQAGVLRHVLSLYPETLTQDELIREMTVSSSEFAERDAINRAVHDLAAVGLLHQEGERILPTRAAVSFYSLDEA